MVKINSLFKERAMKNKIEVIEFSSNLDLKKKFTDFLRKNKIKSAYVSKSITNHEISKILAASNVKIIDGPKNLEKSFKVDLGIFESGIGIAEEGIVGFINYGEIKELKKYSSPINIAFLRSSNLVENISEAERKLTERVYKDKPYIISFSSDKENKIREENVLFNSSMYVFLMES